MNAWLHALPVAALHFMRPHGLWALLALPLLFFAWRKNRQRANVWRDAVDAHLLPHLLAGEGKALRGGFALAAIAWTLAALALAGPSWRQGEQALWQSKQPLVVALDLSSAVNANDLPPSRLLQARAKLQTLLDERSGGEVALVAYAGDAFTVAPLTDDAHNLALFLDALDPGVMPVDGQDAARAIALSAQLLKSAGFGHGDILLVTDHADDAANAAAGLAFGAGYRVSGLGLGTRNGAAYQTAGGRIGQAHLDAPSLRALVAKGGGDYQALTAGDADLRALGLLDPQAAARQQEKGEKRLSWEDDGYWLLLPLMVLAVFAFRRGVLGLVLCVALLPLAQPAQAQTHWWIRADQQQRKRIEQGVAAYRRGDYAAAERVLQGLDLADAQYDRANALARQGKYEEALAAYDAALKQQPQMQDAQANRTVVLEAMKQRQKNGQGQSQGGSGSSSQGKGQQGGDKSRQQGQKSDAPSQQQGQPQEAQAQSKQDSRQDGKQDRNGQDARQQDARDDPQNQQQADAAQRQQMQQAMKQPQPSSSRQNGQAQPAQESAQERERRQAVDAWLRRVPDDPGGLLRSKFRLEYERRQKEGR